jgi:outer membrane protein OmpA-like peptidoglycan-associated protein/tetratricopeptide (TPR) repeat protein
MNNLRIKLSVLLLAGMCCAPLALKAQSVDQADKHYQNYEFAEAIEAYKKAHDTGTKNLAVTQRIADSYRMLNNNKEAEKWYAKVVEYPGAEPINTLYYADAAKQNGNYAKAKKLYLEYAKKAPEQAAMAQRLAAATDTAVAWMNNPGSYIIKKASGLNSKSTDFSPVKDKDGVFFASDRVSIFAANGQKSEDNQLGYNYIQMYYAKALSDSTWEEPKKLGGDINNAYHNGPGSFNQNEQKLYFTRTQVVKRNIRKAISDPTSWLRGQDKSVHVNHHGIFMSQRTDSTWTKAVPFAHNNPENYSVGHPAISKDGKVLYFVSDMPGGFGNTDIYYSEKQADGSWGAPVNAGSVINTSGRESFPTIGEDGTLYFSSTGHTGLGGLDIFKAIGNHKSWSRVVNMKNPINSSNDDFGLILNQNGKSGMFSSSRGNDSGFDNIYQFSEIQPFTFTGKVLAVTGKSEKSPVDSVYLQLSGKGVDKVQRVYSDKDGNFSLEVIPGKTYTLKASKDKFLSQTFTFVADSSLLTDAGRLKIELTRDTPNVPVVLNNIYYDWDKATLRPESKQELDKLVDILKENPNIRIELSSHTDVRGRRSYNQKLSDRRAKSAVDYLISQGINRKRLIARGFGETKPVNDCVNGVRCDNSLHQENRRTEFKILE